MSKVQTEYAHETQCKGKNINEVWDRMSLRSHSIELVRCSAE